MEGIIKLSLEEPPCPLGVLQAWLMNSCFAKQHLLQIGCRLEAWKASKNPGRTCLALSLQEQTTLQVVLPLMRSQNDHSHPVQ